MIVRITTHFMTGLEDFPTGKNSYLLLCISQAFLKNRIDRISKYIRGDLLE